jgi:hypothetical protein
MFTRTRLNVMLLTEVKCLSFCKVTFTLTKLHTGDVIMYWPCEFYHLKSTKLCINAVYVLLCTLEIAADG